MLGGVRFPAGLRQKDRLRFRWSPGEPLPAEELLLFYRYIEEDGQTYLELRLDPEGRPIFGT
jgi:hypothetical protein